MPNYSEFIKNRRPNSGKLTPEQIEFKANLQEFAQRVNYICYLETNGKLTPEAAYEKIYAFWKQLKQSKKQLCIGKTLSQDNPVNFEH